MIPLSIESTWSKWLLGIAGGLGLVVLAYSYGHYKGSAQARATAALEASQALAKAEAAYRAKEQEHAKQIEGLRLEYAKKDAAELAKDAATVVDIRRRATPMRVRIVPASCPIPAEAGHAATGGNAPQEAELAREDSTEIYDVAAYGDETARQLELLQGWARDAVKLCNGGKP